MSKIGGSVLDVGDIVDKMMEIERTKLYHLQATKQVEQSQLGAYGTLQTLFTTFQTQLTALSAAFNTIKYGVNSSNSGVATGSVLDNSVGLGTHSIVVTQLAAAEAYTSSNQFASNTSSLGITETMTFANTANPAANFSLEINPNDALTDIRDHINESDVNIGVTASIISSTGSGGAMEYNLILTAKSGTANEITISGDTENSFNFTQTATAADALFSFDGFNEQTSSNAVSNIIDGLAFNLYATGSTTLTVNETPNTQTSDVQDGISNTLTAYNNIISFLDANQNVVVYDEKNNQFASGSNSSFQYIKAQLNSAINVAVTGVGDIQNLYEVGIVKAPSFNIVDQYDARGTEVTSVGELMISNTVTQSNGMTNLQNALNNNFEDLTSFFTSANGFINNVNNVINNNIIGSAGTGYIASSQAGIKLAKSNTDTLLRNETERLKEVKSNLVAQYSSLNATLSKYQGLSDYLDKQYAYLDNLMRGGK